MSCSYKISIYVQRGRTKLRHEYEIKTLRDLVNYVMTNHLLRKLFYEPRLNHNTPGVILVKGGRVGLLFRSHEIPQRFYQKLSATLPFSLYWKSFTLHDTGFKQGQRVGRRVRRQAHLTGDKRLHCPTRSHKFNANVGSPWINVGSPWIVRKCWDASKEGT